MPDSRSSPPPKFLDAGESALVVEFGRVVDAALHDRVLALDAAVAAAEIDGISETVPTYRSLMVHYDARRLGRNELVERLRALLGETAHRRPNATRRKVPVSFELPHAEDLAEVASKLRLDEHRIVEEFSRASYRLYMYGFLPGFAYLGRLPEALRIPRREAPRSVVQPGAILIAGEQVVIAGVSSPTGWYMIGRTPLRVLDLQRNPPFLFDVGDEIAFEPIDRAAYDRLAL